MNTDPRHFTFCTDEQLVPYPGPDARPQQACTTCGRVTAIEPRRRGGSR